MLDLAQFTFTGTPADIGRQQGEALRDRIHAFAEQRLVAARAYLAERGIEDQDAFLAIGRKCLTQLKGWDEDGWIEHNATAAGAGIDPVVLYTTGNMTDIRDVLLLPARAADAEGCTAVLVPRTHSACRETIAAQTWDLNPGDVDYVVAIHRRPSAGHATWSITCAGCPSLIGMNAAGVAVGTTNIKVAGSRIGIPYLSLLHRLIRCSTFREAVRVLETCYRAAAHTYWVADRTQAAMWECTATTHPRRDLHDVPLCQTNHCQVPGHQSSEGEPPTTSSQARLARMRAMASAGNHTVESLRAAFADRGDGVDSINRFAEDGQGTATNACMVAIPARRELHACRGPADRGRWVQLGFDR